MATAEPIQTTGWMPCEHPDPVVRTRTRANRVQVYVLQCLSCGREMRTLAKTSPEVMRLSERIPFDEDLEQIRYRAYRAAYDRRWLEQQAAAQADAERESREWWDRYTAYLKTPQWRRKRQAVFARSGGICEGCGLNKAVQVHHLTYDHVEDEFLWELAAVCRMCHTRLHPKLGEFYG